MPQRHETLRRAFDIAGSVSLLAATLPVTVAAALSLKIENPKEPVFFNQERTGLHGKRFLVHKFRSMSSDTSKLKEERITRVGRFLRCGIDELPQLINVIKGDMSLVGPRPLMMNMEEMPEIFRDRYAVRPGLTGPAQINGYRGLLPPDGTLEQAAAGLAMDAEFSRNAGLGDYLDILFKTPFRLNTKITLQEPANDTEDDAPILSIDPAANDAQHETPAQNVA